LSWRRIGTRWGSITPRQFVNALPDSVRQDAKLFQQGGISYLLRDRANDFQFGSRKLQASHGCALELTLHIGSSMQAMVTEAVRSPAIFVLLSCDSGFDFCDQSRLCSVFRTNHRRLFPNWLERRETISFAGPQPRGFFDNKQKSAAKAEATLRTPSPANNLAYDATRLRGGSRVRPATSAGPSTVTPMESTSQISQNHTGTRGILSANKLKRTAVPIGINVRKTMLANNMIRICRGLAPMVLVGAFFWILF
jgi:hypothetical protein